MPEPRNPDLEKQIIDNPEDREAYRVLADWLEEQGHPRAELIRLQLDNTGSPAKPERGLFNKHQKELVGGLSKAKRISWRYGFAREVFLDGINFVALDHPSARFLSELRINGFDAAMAEPLAKLLPRTIRELVLSASRSTDPISLSSVWPKLQQLTRLELVGQFDLAGMSLPNVTKLALDWVGDATAAIAELAAQKPPVTVLSLEGQADPGAVCALLAALQLTELALRTTNTDAVVGALCELPTAATIKLLELSRSDVGPSGIDAIVMARPAFEALETIDVQGCTLDEEVYEALDGIEVDVIGDRYDDVDE